MRRGREKLYGRSWKERRWSSLQGRKETRKEIFSPACGELGMTAFGEARRGGMCRRGRWLREIRRRGTSRRGQGLRSEREKPSGRRSGPYLFQEARCGTRCWSKAEQ